MLKSEREYNIEETLREVQKRIGATQSRLDALREVEANLKRELTQTREITRAIEYRFTFGMFGF